MLLIVASHFSAHGVKQVLWQELPSFGLWRETVFFERFFLSFFEVGGTVGVGLFFMLSGFFMIKKNVGVFRLVRLIFQLFFYALIMATLYFVVKKSGFYSFPEYQLARRFLFACVIPITSVSWWFASAYVFICLLSPVLNYIVLKQNRNGMIFILTVAFVFWYIPALLNFTYSGVQRGVFFYLLGAFFRLYNFRLKKWAWFFIAIFFYALYSICIFFSEEIFVGFWESLHFSFLCKLFGWVICPFAVYSIFAFFSEFNFQSIAVNKVASTTFGIYLLHDSASGRAFIWNALICPLGRLGTKSFVPFAIVSVLVVFCVCSVVDFARIYLVERPILPYLRTVYENIKQWSSGKDKTTIS